jgi:hypothetical protein
MEVDRKFLARYWGLVGMLRDNKSIAMLGEEIVSRMTKFGYWESPTTLVEEGLIYELDVPENRRRRIPERKIYALTEKGVKWLEENIEKYNKMFEEYSKRNAVKILSNFEIFAWRNIREFFEHWEVVKALTVSMGDYLLLIVKSKKSGEELALFMKNYDGFNWELRTFDINVTEDVKSWIKGVSQ